MVARPGSPCSRRTQRPSLRSIAGNRITSGLVATHGAQTSLRPRLAAGRSRRPSQKVGNERQTEPLALFRMKLRARIRLERLDHAADLVEPAATIRKSTDARQYDPVGAAYRIRIAGDQDRLVASGLARGTLERLQGRMQIARAVIDDRDGHGRPPG